MTKILMKRDANYNIDGIGIKSKAVKAENVYDVPEWVAETFVKKMGIAELAKEQIETPKEPVLETQDLDLSNLEYKELFARAKEAGFENGKGRPSKDNLIDFLRG